MISYPGWTDPWGTRQGSREWTQAESVQVHSKAGRAYCLAENTVKLQSSKL